MKQQKVLDPNKNFQSVYIRVPNSIGNGPAGLRKWTRLVESDKPRTYQRTGKDTGVI